MADPGEKRTLSVEGNRLTFDSTLRTRTAVMMLAVEATFEGDSMQGMFRTALGDSPFTATRAPGSGPE